MTKISDATEEIARSLQEHLGSLYQSTAHTDIRISIVSPFMFADERSVSVLLLKDAQGQWIIASHPNVLRGIDDEAISGLERILVHGKCSWGHDRTVVAQWDGSGARDAILRLVQTLIAVDGRVDHLRARNHDMPCGAQSISSISMAQVIEICRFGAVQRQALIESCETELAELGCSTGICGPEDDCSYSICSACNHIRSGRRAVARAFIWWAEQAPPLLSETIGSGVSAGLMQRALRKGSVAVGLRRMAAAGGSRLHRNIPMLEYDAAHLGNEAAKLAVAAQTLSSSL